MERNKQANNEEENKIGKCIFFINKCFVNLFNIKFYELLKTPIMKNYAAFVFAKVLGKFYVFKKRKRPSQV